MYLKTRKKTKKDPPAVSAVSRLTYAGGSGIVNSVSIKLSDIYRQTNS